MADYTSTSIECPSCGVQGVKQEFICGCVSAYSTRDHLVGCATPWYFKDLLHRCGQVGKLNTHLVSVSTT